MTGLIYQKKPSKGYVKFKQLLPRDGFRTLTPDVFKELLKIIHNEPDKELKNFYFAQVLDRLFAGGWGWYMRLGQSLSAIQAVKSPANMSEKNRENGLAVLRMVKAMHIELKYKPNYINLINGFIREFGGTTITKEQKAEQKDAKFRRATNALANGDKVPRKLKKAIITRTCNEK